MPTAVQIRKIRIAGRSQARHTRCLMSSAWADGTRWMRCRTSFAKIEELDCTELIIGYGLYRIRGEKARLRHARRRTAPAENRTPGQTELPPYDGQTWNIPSRRSIRHL